jgi:hypothetical protein
MELFLSLAKTSKIFETFEVSDINQNKKHHKPISRILSLYQSGASCHLSRHGIAPDALTAYPLVSGESPLPLRKVDASVYDISTSGVYTRLSLPTIAVSSYLTFSPLPRRSMAVIFCYTFRLSPR